MDSSIERALAITPASRAAERTIDITTTGAQTGRPRRIEVWFYRVDGRIYLSTSPAKRSWYANLVANPDFVFHLKHGVRADLRAVGTPVLDRAEREAVFTSIIADLNQPWNPAGIRQPVEPLEEWMQGSPLIGVEFPEADAA
ncbi:nitroreductase/quinone reductase family protein [Herbiconiux sp. CPCC 203407]|uniref:Nitroreductase/quinone reductase family protein n=1 Tax=Herbiconiux oxytropis TaxID=2970915 RepID=A0AA42BRV7_9MICO|nr:nitroreductase/quinone reductase family protein [Herbiconiux oxytropis]MCS5721533.1 nitroreductase/quinone reductase family protein [Herbiconiux oxytropis]MCS5724610.1 nitroreductase/quinone reductase family protein [Herbiconiux oxytropis]